MKSSMKQHGLRNNGKHLQFTLGLLVVVCAGMLPMAESRDGTAQGTVTPKTETAQQGTVVPKTILDLQPFRQASSIRINSDKSIQGMATLINLNPSVNAWYVLEVDWQGSSKSSYHLENPKPRSQKLSLNPKYPLGIEILEGNVQHPCNLFEGGATGALDQARKSQLPYAPLCDGRLYLRNPVKGHLTKLEAEAEFFRTQVPGGEKVAVIFHHLLEDSHRETSEMRPAGNEGGATAVGGKTEDFPLPAVIDQKYADRVLTPSGLGITLEQNLRAGVRPGVWYTASGNPGVYVSLMEPQLIDRPILESHRTTANTLDSVEALSLCYLVAFDLDYLELAYALGTEHPSVEWSEHLQPAMRDPKLPGPDGIGTISPLVSTGMIGPESASRTVAAFTGGFKRMHGAFKF